MDRGGQLGCVKRWRAADKQRHRRLQIHHGDTESTEAARRGRPRCGVPGGAGNCYLTTIWPLYIPMPQVNAIKPAFLGVIFTTTLCPVSTSFLIPRVLKTT